MEKDSKHTENDKTPTTHASFVLRCWVNGSGQVRARLVDVRTGVVHPLAALERMPEVVRGLLEPLMGDLDK